MWWPQREVTPGGTPVRSSLSSPPTVAAPVPAGTDSTHMPGNQFPSRHTKLPALTPISRSSFVTHCGVTAGTRQIPRDRLSRHYRRMACRGDFPGTICERDYRGTDRGTFWPRCESRRRWNKTDMMPTTKLSFRYVGCVCPLFPEWGFLLDYRGFLFGPALK